MAAVAVAVAVAASAAAIAVIADDDERGHQDVGGDYYGAAPPAGFPLPAPLPPALAQGGGGADGADGAGSAAEPRVISVIGAAAPAALGAPHDVAVNGTGHVFVADAQHGRIKVFSPDGRYLHSIGEKGRGPGQLDRPEGVAVNGTGHVFVADAGTGGRLQVFGPNGSHLAVLAGSGSGRGSLSLPGGVAVGPSGIVYVADTGNSRVLAFNPDGSYLARIGSSVRHGGTLLFPTGVAVGPLGTVYVADFGLDRIEVFGSNRWRQPPISHAHGADGHADRPYGVAVDRENGRVYATLLGGSRVVAYGTADRSHHLAFGEGALGAPSGAAVHQASGNVYVSDRTGGRIDMFNINGSHLGTIGPGAAHGEHGLGHPLGASPGPGGRLAVADTHNDRVLVYEPNSTRGYAHELTVGGNDGLLSPSGVAFGPGGEIYVADQGNARVQVFGPEGAHARTITDAAGALSSPTDVDVDGAGRVAVADGQTVVVVPDPGGGDPLRIGGFRSAAAVAFDPLGRLIVADTFGGAVQVLAPNGTRLLDIREFGRGAHAGDGTGLAALPSGVAAGPHGKIFVAEALGDRVHVFDYAGRSVSSFGSFGEARGMLDAPRDVAVMPDGAVVVADSGNGRVQVFEQADAVPPRPSSASLLPPWPASGVYGEGDTIVVAVDFTEPVRIDVPPAAAAPSLILNMTSGGVFSPAAAAYLEGNNTARLVFSYAVRAGDRAPAVGYAPAEPLDLGGSFIVGSDDSNLADLAGLPAVALLPNGSAAAVFTNRPPSVEPAAGQSVLEGSELRVELRASDPDGDGVRLLLGGQAPPGAVLLPDGVLAWTPAPGQAGLHVIGVLAEDEHGLRSAAEGIRVDVLAAHHLDARDAPAPRSAAQARTGYSEPPAVLSVAVLQRTGAAAVPAQSPVSYTSGQTVDVGVRFTYDVVVDTSGGVPYLDLRTGSAGAHAPYASGSGTDTLVFEYAVRGGDIADRLTYAGADALVLGGGTIAAAGSNAPASLSLPSPGETGSLSHAEAPPVRIEPEPGRPVLDVGILDDGAAGGGPAGATEAALMAAERFNERQGRTDGALVLNATSYDVRGTTGSAAAAAALRSAHSAGAGPSVYVGPSTDRGLHAAMPYAADNNIVLVSAGSTAPSLAVDDDRTFRLLPSDQLEADVLSRIARNIGAESIYAVLDTTTYGHASRPDVPPPQGLFSHGFAAALADSAVPPLSGIVMLSVPAQPGPRPVPPTLPPMQARTMQSHIPTLPLESGINGVGNVGHKAETPPQPLPAILPLPTGTTPPLPVAMGMEPGGAHGRFDAGGSAGARSTPLHASTGSISLDRAVYPVPFGVPDDFEGGGDLRGASIFPVHTTGIARDLAPGTYIPNGDLVVRVRINDPDFDVSAGGEDKIAVNVPRGAQTAASQLEHGPLKVMISRGASSVIVATAGGESPNDGRITPLGTSTSIENGRLVTTVIDGVQSYDPDLESGTGDDAAPVPRMDQPITRELGPITEIAPDAGIFELDLALRYTDGPAGPQCPQTMAFEPLGGRDGSGAGTRFTSPDGQSRHCILQGDILAVEYTDPTDASGNPNTVTDSATFDLRNGALQSDRSVYVIGGDMILTLIEPDLDLDSGEAETYDLDLIEWESGAASTTMGNLGGGAYFDPEPSGLRETGNSTGIFQVVVEVPGELYGGRVERGEAIKLEYIDYGPSGADYVGDDTKGASLDIFASNFGAMIELDQDVYTWTDKVYITVVAPDHNFDPDLVDEIGKTRDDAITVSTRGADLENYRLVETGTDTGIFAGEVILTGFAHDADGDPRTGTNGFDVVDTDASGTGPTDGRLQASGDGGFRLHPLLVLDIPTDDRLQASGDGGITVSFEYSEDETVVASALVRWNIGEVVWNNTSYPSQGTATIKIIDPDMDLDPESVDSFNAEVYSESDLAGIGLVMTETNDATGVFEGTVSFTTTDKSSGHILRVAGGDTITAEYTDATLPNPYSTHHDIDITATSIIRTDVPPIGGIGATIELDQQSYTWTDKVYITVVAPDYNFDPDLADEIGGTDAYPIRISTRAAELERYRLVETGTDTGIFAGEVILTGFAHDADRDTRTGNHRGFDVVYTEPSGMGPTDGRLPTRDGDDGIAVSFKISENSTVLATAPIRWNIGEVEWYSTIYSSQGTGIVRIIDPDMNLDPESVDNFAVEVYSDSDSGGTRLIVTETNDATGVFVGAVDFTTTDESSGHCLRVARGDTITAEYTDGTLPNPYSDDDKIGIVATSIIETGVPLLGTATDLNASGRTDGACVAEYAACVVTAAAMSAGGGAGGACTANDAVAALDALVRSGPAPAAVVYLGSPEGLDALARRAADYPALGSASWLASGLSVGSPLLAGHGPAAKFVADAGLAAPRWSPPASGAAREIDLRLPGMGPDERNSAYAAYDAMGVIGAAAAAAAASNGGSRGVAPDAASIADALPDAAAAYDGALGDIVLDYAGDLWVPAMYDLWTVTQPGGTGTAAEWTRQAVELDETRACSITLTRAKIDYGPIESGQTSRPHLQTIVNTGQLPFFRVDLVVSPWHVDSPGSCVPGAMPSLPVGLSEIRTEQGGAFSDLAATGTVLAQGLEAGSRAPLWYRLSLAGYADLPQAEITQCAIYLVRCG